MICTFYSFKGGVGRSMALANVAELLSRRGLNVLIIDFDLEAPGLERFFKEPTVIQGQRGVIDLLISYQELRSLPPLKLHDTATNSRKLSIVSEPISHFITPIYETNDKPNALSIMPAGSRSGTEFSNYAEKVRFFDWNVFFSAKWEGEKFFDWFREELNKNYDVVLIDSRTGVTEMGGVCVYQLADIVVFFVAAHQQSFEGTQLMAQSLRNEEFIQKGRQGRALRLLFVPSRVEREADEDLFKARFESTFGEFFEPEFTKPQDVFLDLRIPYAPPYAGIEQVAVRNFLAVSFKKATSSYLYDAYKRLTIAITELAQVKKRYELFMTENLPSMSARVEENNSDSIALKKPEGQMPLNFPFYVERPPIESDCYETIMQPGALIRIKAPRQMGKTSLMVRILEHAKPRGCRTAYLSFQEADMLFADLDSFLKSFCRSITAELQLPDKVDNYWKGTRGSKSKCRNYFEQYLLPSNNYCLVLGLDDVDRIFQYLPIATEFFGLLRAWHERGKNEAIWQKFRMVIAYSKEVYIPLDINQSPFNVGNDIELPKFNQAQIQSLVQQHNLIWSKEQIKQLMAMIGGHPYLVRVALYKIARKELTLETFLQVAPTEVGPYSKHLRHHLELLQKDEKLAMDFKQVMANKNSPISKIKGAFKLRSIGLVKFPDHKTIVPMCDLYYRYFREYMP